MKTSEAGKHEIKQWEGCRLEPYICPAGKWTVGFGSRLYPGSEVEGLTFVFGKGWHGKITIETADKLLERDLAPAEKAIAELVTVPLEQDQYDALVSFIFNVGRNAFAGSTLLRRLNKKLYRAAAEEFPRWCHDDHGKVIVGLLRRRNHEKALFLKGEA